MRMTERTIATMVVVSVCCGALGLAGCESGDKGASTQPAANASSSTSSMAAGAVNMAAINTVCPVSGQVITSAAVTETVHGRTIAFASEADRKQFASIPEEKQEALVMPAIMHAAGVVNSECPVSGEAVSPASVTTEVDGVRIAFTSALDQRQFASLPEAKQHAMLGEIIRDGLGTINAQCPVSGKWLHAKSPIVDADGFLLGFASDADMKQWASVPHEAQERLVMREALDAMGVVNRYCPVSGERVTLDSPMMRVNGELIAFASEADQRQWQSIPSEKQHMMVEVMTAN